MNWLACNELEDIAELNLRASSIVLLPRLWHDASLRAQAHVHYGCSAAVRRQETRNYKGKIKKRREWSRARCRASAYEAGAWNVSFPTEAPRHGDPQRSSWSVSAHSESVRVLCPGEDCACSGPGRTIYSGRKFCHCPPLAQPRPETVTGVRRVARAKQVRAKESRHVRSHFAVHEYCPASGRTAAMSKFPRESFRSSYSCVVQTVLQNGGPAAEYRRGVRARKECARETHSSDRTDRSEISAPSPSTARS